MSYNIRSYKHTDYPEIASWWVISTNQLASPDLFCEDGTFILEIDNIPALSITVLLTQSKRMAYLFAFAKNPMFKNNLEEYGKILWEHCFSWAKDKGYKQLICFSEHEKLSDKYERFGMTKTIEHLSSFSKEI